MEIRYIVLPKTQKLTYLSPLSTQRPFFSVLTEKHSCAQELVRPVVSQRPYEWWSDTAFLDLCRIRCHFFPAKSEIVLSLREEQGLEAEMGAGEWMMGEWKNLVLLQAYMLGKFTWKGLPKNSLLHIPQFLSLYKLIFTMNFSFSLPSIFIKQHLVLSLSSTHTTSQVVKSLVKH